MTGSSNWYFSDIDPASTPETGNKRPFDDIAITLTSSALNGSQRVVLDGVTTSDECQELHRLSSVCFSFHSISQKRVQQGIFCSQLKISLLLLESRRQQLFKMVLKQHPPLIQRVRCFRILWFSKLCR